MSEPAAVDALRLGCGETDFTRGSPHLRHPALRARVAGSVFATIAELRRQRPAIDVLEIGAGHGPFTGLIRATGARVVVTEMDEGLASGLAAEFRDDPGVEVLHDPDGRWVFRAAQVFDAVVCISVLHHIPDYLSTVRQCVALTRPGGAFVSWQDPMLYSRLSRVELRDARVAYLAWRLRQGEWRRASRTFIRRARGVLDESRPEDMVEYHVVRDGIDEEALQGLLAPAYRSVELVPYWSSQSAWWQAWGERRGYRSTFGMVATDRHR